MYEVEPRTADQMQRSGGRVRERRENSQVSGGKENLTSERSLSSVILFTTESRAKEMSYGLRILCPGQDAAVAQISSK